MTGGSNGTDVALALVASGGFDVDSRNTSGFTALTWTAIRGDTKTARALLKADADPNVIDDQGFTPLGWAATNGFLEVCLSIYQQYRHFPPQNHSHESYFLLILINT